jgi:hypothetical protein
MAKVRGMGGWWVIHASLLPDPDGFSTLIHNARYEIITAAELKESRTVNCGGWSEFLPVVRRVESATFRVAEDDLSYPQVLGFTEGTELPHVYLGRGELNEYDKITRPVVESVHVENDQKKARWVEIVCRGGIYERGVPAPPLPPGV